MTEHRAGYGYDVHRLATGLRMTLGGIVVSEEIGCVAHSDGDVLLHAICDALLGAAALGDIGKHFPDTDAQYKGISSMRLLEAVLRLLQDASWTPVNVDATVVLEQPKIAPHVRAMQHCIAGALGLRDDAVSIKATTSEGLGFVGRGEGIAAHATAMIRRV